MGKILMAEGLTFDDVLIIPKYSEVSSRSDCSTYLPFLTNKIPVIAANMDTICDFKMAGYLCKNGAIGAVHRYMSIEEMNNGIDSFYKKFPKSEPLIISVGAVANDVDRIDALLKRNEEIFFCVDIAHGHSVMMKETIEYIKDSNPFSDIIAGNVATQEAAFDLFKWGATYVKVGIGPGSVCTTRIKTGVGVPQLTAIMECSKAGPIIADGGIRTPGDVAKAIAAGAHMVMIGSMFAGTDMTPGWDRNKQIVEYRGMASKEAQLKFKGKYANEEGVSVTVERKPKGSTLQVLKDIEEGLKSAMSYVGALDLNEFRQKAQFIRVSNHTVIENHPHFK